MKITLITIIIALVAIGLALFLMPQKNVVAPTTDSKESPVVQEGAAKTFPITNGKVAVVAEKSSVTWTGKKKLIPWVDTGTISIKNGSGVVKDGVIGENAIVFDMKSIIATKTGGGGGQDKLASHLQSKDFFDVETYPTSTLVVKSITPKTAGVVEVTANLTVKGVTHQIVFPATVTVSGTDVQSTGTITLDRTKWNITYGSGSFFDNLGNNVIDDMFTVDFTLVAKLIE